jgi:hypothetical protein
MRIEKFSSGITLFAVVFVGLLGNGCHTARPITSYSSWAQQQGEELRKAGERLGVPVETAGMLNFSQGRSTFSTATARSWRTTPATDLPGGVNFAVAWLDSPGQKFPAGYYALRAFAEPRELGMINGRIQILDASRVVVGEVPATFDIQSLTTPADAAQIAPTIFVDAVHSSQNGPKCKFGNRTCWCCTNGVLVCSNMNNAVD